RRRAMRRLFFCPLLPVSPPGAASRQSAPARPGLTPCGYCQAGHVRNPVARSVKTYCPIPRRGKKMQMLLPALTPCLSNGLGDFPQALRFCPELDSQLHSNVRIGFMFVSQTLRGQVPMKKILFVLAVAVLVAAASAVPAMADSV